MINHLICILVFFLISCTPSPRYTPNQNQNNSSKSNQSSKKKLVKSQQGSTRYNNKSTSFNSNKTYDRSKKILRGISSYYGPKFHGKLTANGEVFDMYGLTAAHKTLPLNTIVRVTNLENEKNLILRINDRGPYVGDRILDCSYGAAKKLDFVNKGITKVKIEVIEWGDNKYMKHD